MTRTHSPLAKILLIAALGTTLSTPTFADDDKVETSASVTVTTDYRFRGVSLSDKKPALQGSFEVSSGGFYAGTWASSLTRQLGASLELDYYAGYGGSIGKVDYDLGLTVYTYPDADDFDYVEGYASLSGAFDKIGWTTGVAYIFSGQDNLGDDDGVYFFADTSTEIGSGGLAVNTHFGYENGVFADEKWDWTLGVSIPVDKFSLAVDYVDTNQNFRGADAGVMISLSAGF